MVVNDALFANIGVLLKDADGNVTEGAATALECTGTLLRSEPEGPADDDPAPLVDALQAMGMDRVLRPLEYFARGVVQRVDHYREFRQPCAVTSRGDRKHGVDAQYRTRDDADLHLDRAARDAATFRRRCSLKHQSSVSLE